MKTIIRQSCLWILLVLVIGQSGCDLFSEEETPDWIGPRWNLYKVEYDLGGEFTPDSVGTQGFQLLEDGRVFIWDGRVTDSYAWYTLENDVLTIVLEPSCEVMDIIQYCSRVWSTQLTFQKSGDKVEMRKQIGSGRGTYFHRAD